MELSPSQYDKIVELLSSKGMTKEQIDAQFKLEGLTPPDLSSKALDYGLRALDYTSGLGRGAAAGLMEPFTDENLVNFADVIKGKTPSSSEILEKLGTPELGATSDILPMMYSDSGDEWFKAKKGGALDVTGRGVLGLAGDVGLDPLTYLTLGAAPAISKLGKGATVAAKPLATGIEKVGESIYKSGLKALDTRAIEKGGEAVSPYMLKQGMGFLKGQEGLLGQMNKRIEDLGQIRANKYAEVPDAIIDPSKASAGAMEYLQKLDANPYMAPQVAEGLDFLSLANKPMDVATASNVKTQLYDALPQTAFDASGRLTSMGQNLNQKLSQGYKNEIVDQLNAKKLGLGDEVDLINQEMGAYLGAQKPLRKEIAKEGRKDTFTQVDAITGMFSPQALAAKQAIKTLNAGPVRTTLGLTANQLGKNVPETLWRLILLEAGDTNGR